MKARSEPLVSSTSLILNNLSVFPVFINNSIYSNDRTCKLGLIDGSVEKILLEVAIKYRKTNNMVATAYAKDLPCRIVPGQVEAEERILEALKPSIEYVARTTNRMDHDSILDKLSVATEARFDSFSDRDEVQCLQGTRIELLQQIMEWAMSPSQKSIFWLNGMAWTGKSTISRTVVRSPEDTNHLGASFYFKRGEGDRAKAKKFFPTLTRQLILRISELRSGVQKAFDQDPGTASKSLKEQFEKLLLQPLLNLDQFVQQTRTTVIVVNALDECEHNPDVRNIIRLLPLLQKAKALRLHIFLTSRPEPSIHLSFSKTMDNDYQDLTLDKILEELTAREIQFFLKDQFTKINRDRNITTNWPGDDVIQQLVTMSVPLFISIAPVCRYIANSRWEPRSRLEELLTDQAKYVSRMDKTYVLPSVRWECS